MNPSQDPSGPSALSGLLIHHPSVKFLQFLLDRVRQVALFFFMQKYYR